MSLFIETTRLIADAAPSVEPEMIEMAPSLTLVLAIGAFVSAGVYLLLERSLTRVLLGVILIGNGINLLFMVSGGRAGGAPITGVTPENEMSDPLPQAMVLTAIVITMGLTAFVVAMAYRSWQLLGHDEVQDDLEDRRISRLAARNAPSVTGDDSDGHDDEFTPEEVASVVRDETSDSSEPDFVERHETVEDVALKENTTDPEHMDDQEDEQDTDPADDQEGKVTKND